MADNQTHPSASNDPAAVKFDGLIALLEKARGPDWNLSRSIFEAVCFPTVYMGSTIESWSRASLGHGYTVNTVDGYRHLDAFNAPSFTSSIDQALSLVPEGHRWYVADNDRVGGAAVAAVYTTEKLLATGCIPRTEALTPALAVCIAALKARAALSKAEGV